MEQTGLRAAELSKYTGSGLITEVKQHRARIVLGWLVMGIDTPTRLSIQSATVSIRAKFLRMSRPPMYRLRPTLISLDR